MHSHTVIIKSFCKRRYLKNSFSFMIILLAVIEFESLSHVTTVQCSPTQAEVSATENNVSEKLTKDVNNSEDVDGTELKVSDSNMSNIIASKAEADEKEIVDDSQAEGDASHDEAYNSIISSYYTIDPFFGGDNEITNLDAHEKERKLVASEKVRNGKVRHKFRVKTKITNPVLMLTNGGGKSINKQNEQDRRQRIPAPLLVGGGEKYSTEIPVVKSLPPRRNSNLLNKKGRNAFRLRSATKSHENKFNADKNIGYLKQNEEFSPIRARTLPRFSDQHAFPPNDNWLRNHFQTTTSNVNKYLPPYVRNRDVVGPKPDEISQLSKKRHAQLPIRNRVSKINPDVEKREISSNILVNDYRGNENIDMDLFDADDNVDGRYAMERQSFSELLPDEDIEAKEPEERRKIKPKTNTRTKSTKARKYGKNISPNFRESEEFPGDERGDIPFLPEIEGGKSPFNFIEPNGFEGKVVAGFPGAPPSQSFFEIMDDFFDEPSLISMFPPLPPPKAPNHLTPPSIHYPKYRYEENTLIEPHDFPSPFDGEGTELFREHLPHLKTFLDKHPHPEPFEEGERYHPKPGPPYLPEHYHSPKPNHIEPSYFSKPPYHHKENAHDHHLRTYPLLKDEYHHFEETESYYNNHAAAGYVPQKSNIKRPFGDDEYLLSIKEGHPYAKPLEYHNPLDIYHDLQHVQEVEIRKLPLRDKYNFEPPKKYHGIEPYHHPTSSYIPYRDKYTPHHTDVRQLPPLPHHKYNDPPPVYHPKPEKYPIRQPYSDKYSYDKDYYAKDYHLKKEFKSQSPYAYDLVSHKGKTPYYDDYRTNKFRQPIKRENAESQKDRRHAARHLHNIEELIMPANGFLDIPKINIEEAIGGSHNPEFSTPAQFKIPKHLLWGLEKDLEIEPYLHDTPPNENDLVLNKEYGNEQIKREVETKSRNPQRNIRIKNTLSSRNNKPNFDELSGFPSDDGWLQRSINSPTASFDEEYLDDILKGEPLYHSNAIELTPPERGDKTATYNYEPYAYDYDVLAPLPILPPPPEMLEMTGGRSFPFDVPKLGSRIPYQPPELLFNEFHKTAAGDALRLPIDQVAVSRLSTVEKQSALKSHPSSLYRNYLNRGDTDRKFKFDMPKLSFEERIDEMYSNEKFDKDISDLYISNEQEDTAKDSQRRQKASIPEKRENFESIVNDIFPSIDVQKRISERYDSGSKIKENFITTISNHSLPGHIYQSEPSDFSPSLNEAIQVTDPPKDLNKERQNFIDKYRSTTPSPPRRLRQPLNEVEIPTYREYDPMAFKFIKESEMQQKRQYDSVYDSEPSEFINPHQFQSRTLDVGDSASDKIPFERKERMSEFEYDYPEENNWSTGNSDENKSGSNRRYLSYGRSLAEGPIPAIFPHPPPPIPALDSTHNEPHQFVHVDDWDKFKAGHGRGNPYHNLQDIQERDGVHHKEAVSWFDAYGGRGKQYFEYNHGDKYGGYYQKKSSKYPYGNSRNSIEIEDAKI